jgi:hypothetical protein
MIAKLLLISFHYRDKIKKYSVTNVTLLEVAYENYLGLLRQIDLVKSFDTNQLASLLQAKGNKVNSYEKNNIVHFVVKFVRTLNYPIWRSGGRAYDESGKLMTIAEFFNGDYPRWQFAILKKPTLSNDCNRKESNNHIRDKQDQLFDLFAGSLDFLKSYLEYISDHSVILGVESSTM